MSPPDAPSTDSSTNSHEDSALWSDRSFWGLMICQFLGAFNDNVVKQLVMLICIDRVAKTDYQATAVFIFAAPFIALSGVSGWFADRTSKQSIIVACKVAEILIALLGMLAFACGGLTLPLVVLFLMGTHSAVFAPAKYGILPELFPARLLARANGLMLMTTFLAIILGFSLAGYLKEAFADRLWMTGFVTVSIASVGAITSLLIRRTPVATPGLRMNAEEWFVPRDIRQSLSRQPMLFSVLIASSVFWCLGGLFQPTVNRVGLSQLQLGDQRTSLLQAAIAIGIGFGSVIAGRLAKGALDRRLVRLGTWGMFVCLLLLGIRGPTSDSVLLGVQGMGVLLAVIGGFAGIFAVPLQVYIQSQAPATQKGRILGTMNLMNWIGIGFAGLYYRLAQSVVDHFELPLCTLFWAGALLLVPLLFARWQMPSLETEQSRL